MGANKQKVGGGLPQKPPSAIVIIPTLPFLVLISMPFLLTAFFLAQSSTGEGSVCLEVVLQKSNFSKLLVLFSLPDTISPEPN